MTSQAKCPKCGMVQMARATCKACGTSLGGPTQHVPRVRSVSDVGMGETSYPNWLQRNRKLLMLGGMGVLLVFAGIYGVRTMSTRAEAKRRVEAERRAAEAERRAANEALQTLRGLQSVTTAGIAYQEYARRVLDAKIQVDSYLEAEGGDPEIKMNAHQAMTLYVFASSAWNAHIARNYEAVANHPALDFCPPAKALRDKKVELTPEEQILRLRGVTLSPKKEKGIAVVASIPLLWECTSDKIAEIERLLKDPS